MPEKCYIRYRTDKTRMVDIRYLYYIFMVDIYIRHRFNQGFKGNGKEG